MKNKNYLLIIALITIIFSCNKNEEEEKIIPRNTNQEYQGFSKGLKINNKPEDNQRKVIVGNVYPPGTYYNEIQMSVIDYTPIGVVMPMTFTVRIIYVKDANGVITSIQNLESGLAGFTSGCSWSTKDWAAVVSGNRIYFEIHGDFKMGATYQGVDCSYTRKMESTGYLNISTGEFITTWHEDDNTVPGVLHNWNPSQPANGTYAPYNGSGGNNNGSGGGGGGGNSGGGWNGGWNGGGGGGWFPPGGGGTGGGNSGGTGGGGSGNNGGGGGGGSGSDDGEDMPEENDGEQVAGQNTDNNNPFE